MIEDEYKNDEIKKYKIYMCSKCKFYKNECTKKRTVRECVRNGLKNKE